MGMEQVTLDPPRAPPDRRELRALAVTVGVLALLALHVTRSLLAPLVLAAWFAALSAPLMQRLSNRFGRRRWVGAITTVVLVLLVCLPVVLIAVPLAGMVADAADTVMHAPPQSWMHRLVSTATEAPRGGGPHTVDTAERVVAVAQRAGPAAATFASKALSVASHAVLQFFILAVATYYFAAKGPRIIAHIEAGAPISREHFRRLVDTFMQVARAMLVGEVLTAAAQGIAAGVIYAILHVPNAAFFGVLTGFVSLIPTIGSALVWVPLCAVLLAAGRARDAAILAVTGVVIIGTIDNILRPFFARFGANQIHPLPLLLGIFGGIEVFGGWGIILGPLVVSLFLAAWDLWAEARTEAA
jgi:predicted PurR-regulated permease PerM